MKEIVEYRLWPDLERLIKNDIVDDCTDIQSISFEVGVALESDNKGNLSA
jgi:hypothetical protein